MAQGRVTDYFATRKRNRFNQDEVLLNKQRKTQNLIEPGIETHDEIKMLKAKLAAIEQPAQETRCLRSKAKQQTQNIEPEKPIELPPTRRTRKSKEQIDALKAKINKFDFELTKLSGSKELSVAQEEKSQPEPVKPEAPTKKTTKRTVNSAELKQKIEQFNKNLLSIQSQFDNSPVEAVPKVVESTVKEIKQSEPVQPETQIELPAYLKFKDLASSDLDPSSKLTLPKTYGLLLDAFKGSDTIIKMLFNRDEIVTFLKLKMGIQNITKHNFTHQHLGQIKTVYPEAYTYKQEKLFIDFKNDYHLIVSPNLNEIEEEPVTGLKRFTPNVLLLRLNKFESSLIQLVKKLHQAFLNSIGITEISNESIKRWHPKFDLENVQPIEESELPKPPKDESIKCKTGQELLNIAKVIYSARIQEAINKTVTVDLDSCKLTSENNIKKQETVVKQLVNEKSNSNLTQDEQVINKLKEKKESSYNALLEKIRNKQKQKEFESMIINSDKEKSLAKYGHYKEAIRFLMFHFQAEKKSVVEFDKCSLKMSESSKAKLTEIECRDLIKSMTGEAPENMFIINEKKWLNMLKVRNIFYLQMDKTFQLNDLTSICDNAIEKLA